MESPFDQYFMGWISDFQDSGSSLSSSINTVSSVLSERVRLFHSATAATITINAKTTDAITGTCTFTGCSSESDKDASSTSDLLFFLFFGLPKGPIPHPRFRGV
jgi:hypothetical protein